MNKTFLFLYPVKEYLEEYLSPDEEMYASLDIKSPIALMEECIQKRYRDKGYNVVFATYPNKDIYALTPQAEDRIIYTDTDFDQIFEAEKKNIEPVYPDEQTLISKLGEVDKLIVGGFHATDCVKRIAEAALNNGIDTLVDMDLTDYFFTLYNIDSYFNPNEYDPIKCKNNLINPRLKYAELFFKENFSSPVYGFYESENKIK